MKDSRTTFSLIGARYLDTQLKPDEIDLIELELVTRGITGSKRWLLEYIAAGGLWWNIIWWEWIGLDGRDVRIGWLYNLFIGSALFAFAAYFFGWRAATAAAVIAHLATVYLGFSLRSGTVPDQKDA